MLMEKGMGLVMEAIIFPQAMIAHSLLYQGQGMKAMGVRFTAMQVVSTHLGLFWMLDVSERGLASGS